MTDTPSTKPGTDSADTRHTPCLPLACNFWDGPSKHPAYTLHTPLNMNVLWQKPQHKILAHSGTRVIARFWNGSYLCIPEH